MPLAARFATRIVRVNRALGAGTREVKYTLALRLHLGGEEELAVFLYRTVVLVREHDDRKQRIRPQKVGALSEEHSIGALRHSLVIDDDDHRIRIGIDQ